MTHAESSYEGAVRRMRLMESQRLPPPAFDLAGARQRAVKSEPDLVQLSRIRDLEELASLACEENERVEAAMATLRDENASLQRRITMLEAAIADPRTALGLTALPRSGEADEPDPDAPPTRGAWLRACLTTVAIGLGGAMTMTIAAGLLAADAGVLGVSRLRSAWLGAADGAAALLDDAIARGGTPHPRYGRGFIPAGWAPTLPAPVVVPPKPVVAAPVPAPAEPAVGAPVRLAPKALKSAHKARPAPAKATQSRKKAASLSHKARKANDPLAGLDL